MKLLTENIVCRSLQILVVMLMCMSFTHLAFAQGGGEDGNGAAGEGFGGETGGPSGGSGGVLVLEKLVEP